MNAVSRKIGAPLRAERGGKAGNILLCATAKDGGNVGNAWSNCRPTRLEVLSVSSGEDPDVILQRTLKVYTVLLLYSSPGRNTVLGNSGRLGESG